ncbi:dopamine receptor 2-like [Dendronephthya gigantea]|uniref:dopamine receptor 2-like n=1 Tax=Dendronephthya gigantea TaxID=151771 RepID=UPI00106D10CF|nr:dopamine receptor 2-like [Dendronephthya gigantea]
MTNSDRLALKDLMERISICEKTILILITFGTLFGNTLVLIVTWRDRSLHQPNKYFIALLAVADLMVGLFVEPFNAYHLMHISLEKTSIHACRFMVWIDTFALTASIYTLSLISADRYLKISKPFQYKSIMTTSRSLKIIAVVVFISISFAIFSATPRSGSLGILSTGIDSCNFAIDLNAVKIFHLFMSISLFFLPALIILIMYALIFLVAHKRNKMLARGELGQTTNTQSQRTALRKDVKVIKMLLIVAGVFICCWGPIHIWMLLWFYYPNFSVWNTASLSYWKGYFVIAFIVRTLPLLNSLFNPIIYACLDKTYRDAFKHLFQRMICHLTMQDNGRQ